MPIRQSDEKRGIAALVRAAKPLLPFKDPMTQYFILGDGYSRRMAINLGKVAVAPSSPAMSIDPAYTSRPQRRGEGRPAMRGRQWPPKSTRRVIYVDSTAEKHRIRSADLKYATNIVVLSCRAHTSVAAFVTRLRAKKPRATKIFAAALTCHFPGLRGKVSISQGWQLLCPRGTVGDRAASTATVATRRIGRYLSRGSCVVPGTARLQKTISVATIRRLMPTISAATIRRLMVGPKLKPNRSRTPPRRK